MYFTSFCHSNAVTANLIKDSNKAELLLLWEAVRFPLLSAAFMTQVVEKSPFVEVIKQTASYQNAVASTK